MRNTILVIIAVSLIILNPKTVNGKVGLLQVPFYIYNAASQFNIDAALLYAVCKVESNCRPRAINHDDGNKEQKAAGIVDKSYGMFQIKLSTAESLGFVSKQVKYVEKIKHGHTVKIRTEVDFKKDLLKPEINSYYAAKLLRKLYDRYGDNTPKVISAYNAGHPIKGNKDYVSKVAKEYLKAKIDKRL